MMLSVKLPYFSSIKTEPEDEVPEESKVPDLNLDDFDSCASCNTPFKGKKNIVDEPEEQGDGEPRRGQQPSIETVGGCRKIKEFYSFNTVTGELLHVTALQALLAVFELRLLKSAPGINLHEANDKLGFCQNCGTLMSQLYKLHQEVTGLLHNGSIVHKLLEYEDLLTDCQETDFNCTKKRKTIKNPSKVNGISLMDDMDQSQSHDDVGGDSDWRPDDSTADSSWNDDNDMDQNDDMDYNNDESTEEINLKPIISHRKTVGIKITSVGSAQETLFNNDDLSSDETSGSRSRRSTCRKVDYAKVLEGPKIDGIEDDVSNDDEWQEDNVSKSGGRTTARKKTGGSPPTKKGRGRPSKGSTKSAKVVVPPPKRKESSDGFKLPAEKSSREATCQICRKIFPSTYLAEHMNVAHNAVQGQPCLICGKFFENSYKAIKHLLTHVPEKAFGCSRCHATFKTAEERNVHTSTHPDFDKKLDCQKCTLGFTSLLLLNKHEAQKHRTTKSFLCSICAKLLTGKDEWIQHILSHGPFQCYYCREFLRPGEYKRHVQTVHMGNRPRAGSSSGTTAVIAEVTLD